MEFHPESWNQFCHASQPDAVLASSNSSAVPDDVFVDFYHKIHDSESIATATAPKTLQQAYSIPPQEYATPPSISLMPELAQEAA